MFGLRADKCVDGIGKAAVFQDSFELVLGEIERDGVAQAVGCEAHEMGGVADLGLQIRERRNDPARPKLLERGEPDREIERLNLAQREPPSGESVPE